MQTRADLKEWKAIRRNSWLFMRAYSERYIAMDITTPQRVTEITRAESTTTRAARYLWALTRLCLG